MRKLKIYLDTSVINFLFAEDSEAYRNDTVDFFDNYVKTGYYDVYVSDVVIEEINRTKDIQKRNKLLSVISSYKIKIYQRNAESELLAKKYIENNIIPLNKPDDARHIAIATINNFDILLSWNFKHLANVKKQLSIKILNEQYGYNYPLILTTPLEVLYEND
jgi:hypothetical protein